MSKDALSRNKLEEEVSQLNKAIQEMWEDGQVKVQEQLSEQHRLVQEHEAQREQVLEVLRQRDAEIKDLSSQIAELNGRLETKDE